MSEKQIQFLSLVALGPICVVYLCLQWDFSLNNFTGIDLVKLIPHTVYSYGLRIRPTLSVHGAETPCRNEVKRCHFALQ